jgi:hypothetical protein
MLPPEDLLDAGYVPSLWRAQRFVLRVLLPAVLGVLPINAVRDADRNVHRKLADTRRRRKPQIRYPVRQ